MLLNPNLFRDQYAQLLEQPDMIRNLRLVCNPSDAELSPVYCNSWQNHTAAFEGEDVTQPGPSYIDLGISGAYAQSLQSAMNAAPSPHLVQATASVQEFKLCWWCLVSFVY